MLPQLDHRYRRVCKAIEDKAQPEEGGLEARLYAHVEGTEEDPVLEYALEIYMSPAHKEAVEGFLLAGGTDDIISDILEIRPIEVLEAYRYLFFDMAQLKNRVDRMLYAQTVCSAHTNRAVSEANKVALTAGADYLAWFWNPEKAALKPSTVINRHMVDGYYRSFAHAGAPLTSKLAQEALKLAKDATRSAKLAEDMNPSDMVNAAEAVRLAIEQFDSTKTVEELGVSPEELLN